MTPGSGTGDVFVSLSDLFDALKTRLGDDEINRLLWDLIGGPPQATMPGDLITADWARDLMARLAALEGTIGKSAAHRAAVITFHDAWSFYVGLAKQGAFLPQMTSQDALKSAFRISASLQDIAYVALSGGALSYVTAADNLLEAFGLLYNRQHELVVLFSAPIPGIPDTTDHKWFATLLNIALEQNDSLGGLSLKNALDSKDLAAAIAAQNRINGIVMNQGGDVTTGNLEVTYLGSTRGETLVRNDAAPFIFLFRVSNKTNRTLQSIQLKAEFLSPRTSWTQFSSVIDPTSRNSLSSISLSPFDPLKPNDPAATKTIGVSVTTPTGTADGDKGALRLTASVPAPVNVLDGDIRELTVGSNEAPPAPATVAFTPQSPSLSGDLSNVPENSPIILDFTLNFNVLQGPSTRDFRTRLEISSLSTEAPLFDIQFGPAALAIDDGLSTAIRKVSHAFPMTSGSSKTWRVVVTPQTGSKGKQLRFKAVVESVADGIKAERRAADGSDFTLIVP